MIGPATWRKWLPPREWGLSKWNIWLIQRNGFLNRGNRSIMIRMIVSLISYLVLCMLFS